MADEPTNLIFEYLRRIDMRLDGIETKLDVLLDRVSFLEDQFAVMKSDLALMRSDVALIDALTGSSADRHWWRVEAVRHPC